MREAAAVRRTEHRDPSVFPLEWTTCDSARVVWTRHCTDAVPVSPNWHPGQMHPSYRWLFLQLPANPPRPYSTECRCPPLRRTLLSLGREHSRHHRSHYHRRWDIHHFQAYQKLELNAEKKFSLCRRCCYQDCLLLLAATSTTSFLFSSSLPAALSSRFLAATNRSTANKSPATNADAPTIAAVIGVIVVA